MTAVTAESLTHHFGDRTALRDISFVVQPGQRVCLLGPNGSGKTTLFRLLATALKVQSGSLHVFGLDVANQAPSVRSVLGTVFQSPALDGELTVRENLNVFAALYGVPRQERRRRISELMEALRIADRATDRVSNLSGGLQRRCDLARGLLHAPRMLLLDEPTGGLDPSIRAEFWSLVQTMQREHDLTVIAATHLFDEAEDCDVVAIMDRGRISAFDAPEVLTSSLGSEVLWIDSEEPDLILRSLPDFAVGKQHGRKVRVVAPDPAVIVTLLREVVGSSIRSATIRRPDLADVFEAVTNRSWGSVDAGPS